MLNQQVISISECLSLWNQNSSIEIQDTKSSKKEGKRLKIGRDSSGKLLRVSFRYLENSEIEIYSARRVK